MSELDWDLAASPRIAERVADDDYARDLYAALCNVDWRKGAGEWSCSWRTAGGIVAKLRGKGEDYMDFYCSGNEGQIAPQIAADLAMLGWRGTSMEGCDL